MRSLSRIGYEIKGLVVFLWKVARGGRHCYCGCGRFAAKPHRAFGHDFFDRLCAANWRKLVDDANRITLEQRARGAGVGA